MYKAIFMYKTINKTSPNYLHINRGEYVHTRSAVNGNLFIPKLSPERTKIFMLGMFICGC